MKTINRTLHPQVLISAAALTTLLIIFVLSSCSLLPKFGLNFPGGEPSVTKPSISPDKPQTSNTPEISMTSTPPGPSLAEVTETPCIVQAMPGRPFDVTIPDGTEVLAGRKFIKTWRLMNSGTCSWTPDYSLIWFSGAKLAEQIEIYFQNTVKPGEVVDVSVEMIAPLEPGKAQSNWKLQDDEGTLFGIGPNGDSPFWVDVTVLQVVSVTPDLTYTPTPTPLVFSRGLFTMLIDDGFDLDNGFLNPISGIDISFHLLENGEMSISPENGVRLALAGSDASYYYCINAFFNEENVIISEDVIGQSICYQTNLGLPGMLKLIQVQLNDQLIEISYITWVAP